MRVLCLLVMALLAGCGQKGPLYMAEDRPEAAQPLGGDRLGGEAENEDSSQDDDDQE